MATHGTSTFAMAHQGQIVRSAVPLLTPANVCRILRQSNATPRDSIGAGGGRNAHVVAAVRSNRRNVAVRAVDTEKPKVDADDETKPGVAKIADAIGLPTEDGLFGFVPFSEVWVGRLAMVGFLSSVIGEFLTGKGTLQQVGLITPSPATALTISLLAGGATLYGTVQTLIKAQRNELPPKQVQRYKAFFGIQPDSVVNAEADRLKEIGDFTSPDDFKAIAEARAQGTPADSFLDTETQDKEANETADALKSSSTDDDAGLTSVRKRIDIAEQTTAQSSEWAYARQVEVTNGRYAALGFLGCIIVEAITGRGIIGQVILYLRLSNILGPASGFQ